MQQNNQTPFGLYIHWPFCKSKCPYCDFNSHVHDSIDHDLWRECLLRELDYYAEKTPGRILRSIFFGGGTPSLMLPDTVAALIDRAQKKWNFANEIEITLEANPTSIEMDKFRDFRLAGVNRVSVGIQSLNLADLKFLGRQHDVDEGRKALGIAATVFDRFSFDLIYARPNQSIAAWEQELKEALSFAPHHMSLYQLTIEPGTAFFTQHARGDFDIPHDALAGDLYEATQAMMESHGLPAYEISNHARPGQESRHNLVYWQYGDYAGIGPGAHGRLTLNGDKTATRAHRAPDIWLKSVRDRGHGGHPPETVAPPQRLIECVMMGLRLAQELPWQRMEQESGRPRETIFEPGRLDALIAEGYVTRSESGIATTPAGRQRLNALLSYLLGGPPAGAGG